MHQLPGVGDGASEHFPDGLMAQAHPQDGEFPFQFPESWFADPCIAGPAGPGRQDQVVRLELPDPFHRNGIVPDHLDVWVQGAHILIQIVGKAVVVVDDQFHVTPPWLLPKPAVRPLPC